MACCAQLDFVRNPDVQIRSTPRTITGPRTPPYARGTEAEQRIVDQIRALSAGQLASYGEIARRAGLPRRARLVARVLAANTDPHLPWHRVIRSDRRIAFAVNHPLYIEQARRLVAEGHRIADGGRISSDRSVAATSGVNQDLDRLLFLAPDAGDI